MEMSPLNAIEPATTGGQHVQRGVLQPRFGLQVCSWWSLISTSFGQASPIPWCSVPGLADLQMLSADPGRICTVGEPHQPGSVLCWGGQNHLHEVPQEDTVGEVGAGLLSATFCLSESPMKHWQQRVSPWRCSLGSEQGEATWVARTLFTHWALVLLLCQPQQRRGW